MKELILKAAVISLFIVLTGCAATYKPINPKSLNYLGSNSQEGISFSYKYDVLRERGNNRYAKKENKKGIKLVAVRLTNNTDTTISIAKHVSFFAGGNQIFPLEPVAIKHTIKQIVPSYLPYLLLTFLNFYVATGNSVEVYPIGLVLGPGITIGNMATSATANARLFQELNRYNLLHQDIKKGETLYGIIGFARTGYDPIEVKINKK